MRTTPFLPLALLVLTTPLAAQDQVALNKPKFTISRETTYFTEPLDKDGFVDYVQAVNQRLRKGVTPENNAAVLFVKAMGPSPDGPRMNPEFFKWLGLAELPDEGDYFIGITRYIKERPKGKGPGEEREWYDQMDELKLRPWTAKEYPHFADWLKVNDKALSLVVAGTKRTHYYSPLIPGHSKEDSRGLLLESLIPSVQKCRELGSALVLRALLNLGEGRPDDAWHDLLACHRLARHVGKGATLIEGLVGIALESMATTADLSFLEKSGYTGKRLQACLKEFDQLPPMAPMIDKIDGFDRWIYLDIVSTMARNGLENAENIFGGRKDGGGRKNVPLPKPSGKDLVNWNKMLRDGNKAYDRLVTALRPPERSEREVRLRVWEKEMVELRASRSKSPIMDTLLAVIDTDARTKKINDVLLSLLMPAITNVQQAADRAEQNQQNLRIAFALAAYKSDEKKYPAKLEALAPRYLPQIPKDLFCGKELIYRPTETGYLLYSVGVNGRDDGGRGRDNDPPGDDLPIRMPVPRKNAN